MFATFVGDIIASPYNTINTSSPFFDLCSTNSGYTTEGLRHYHARPTVVSLYTAAVADWVSKAEIMRFPERLRYIISEFQQDDHENTEQTASTPRSIALLEPILRSCDNIEEAKSLAQRVNGVIEALSPSATPLSPEDLNEYIDFAHHVLTNHSLPNALPLGNFPFLSVLASADSYEDALRRAVALGGHSSETAACIATLADALFPGEGERLAAIVQPHLNASSFWYNSINKAFDTYLKYHTLPKESLIIEARGQYDGKKKSIYIIPDELIGNADLRKALEKTSAHVALGFDAGQAMIRDLFGYKDNAASLHAYTFDGGALVGLDYYVPAIEKTFDVLTDNSFELFVDGSSHIYIAPDNASFVRSAIRRYYGSDAIIVNRTEWIDYHLSAYRARAGYFADKDGHRTDLTIDTYNRLPQSQQARFVWKTHSGTYIDTLRRPYLRKLYIGPDGIQSCYNHPNPFANQQKRDATRKRFLQMRSEVIEVMTEFKRRNSLDNLDANADLHLSSGYYALENDSSIALYKGGVHLGGYRVNPDLCKIVVDEGDYRGGEYLDGAMLSRCPFTGPGDDVKAILSEYILDETSTHYSMDIDQRRYEQEQAGNCQAATNDRLASSDLAQSDDPLIAGDKLVLVEQSLREGLLLDKSASATLIKASAPDQAITEKPSVYIFGLGSKSIYDIKSAVQTNAIDIVAPTFSLSRVRDPKFSYHYLSKVLSGSDCGLVDMSYAFYFRNKDFLGPNGYVDFEKLQQSKQFADCIRRLDAAQDKGYKVMFLSRESYPLDSPLFCTLGRYLSDNGYNVKYITGGQVQSHAVFENRLVSEYDLPLDSDPAKREAYSRLNAQIGFNPTQHELAKQAGERYRNERQALKEKLAQAGAFSLRKRTKRF